MNRTIKEKYELIGIAKILDSLWENSANERDMSKRIKKELVYFFGENWSEDMYNFAGIKGVRPEFPEPLSTNEIKIIK